MALKVLLADASAPAKNQGKKILEDAGYEVAVCSNGLEAQRRINESAPDLAILDVFLPGYTGIELCERLRANAPTASLPVILTFGKLEPYPGLEGERVRASAVVVKPFAEQELLSAVRNLIGSPAAGSARKSAAAPLAARNKPLLEWWDPAAEAIERSIAAAQLRRGALPSSMPVGQAAPGASESGSAAAAQEPPAENATEDDLEPPADFCEHGMAEESGEASAGEQPPTAAPEAQIAETFEVALAEPLDCGEWGEAPAECTAPEIAIEPQAGEPVTLEAETAAVAEPNVRETSADPFLQPEPSTAEPPLALLPNDETVEEPSRAEMISDGPSAGSVLSQDGSEVSSAAPAALEQLPQANIAVTETGIAVTEDTDAAVPASWEASPQAEAIAGAPEAEGRIVEAGAVADAPADAPQPAQPGALSQDALDCEPLLQPGPDASVFAEGAHGEAERVRQVIELVFEHFRPLLVDAVLRELANRP